MRDKSWPYWSDWQFIFGKDRAEGGDAEFVIHVEKNVQAEKHSPAGDGLGDYHIFVDEIGVQEQVNPTGGSETGEHSPTNAQTQAAAPKKPSRKRKGVDVGEGLLNMLGNLHAETNARLDTLSTRIGYDMDLGKARRDIFRHLDKMAQLTDPQKYDLCDIIGKENSRLEIFMGLPDAKKPGYVLRVMEKEQMG